MRKRNIITLKWLEKEDACGPGIKWFKHRFGKSAPTADVVRTLYRSNCQWDVSWVDWVLEKCLPSALCVAWRQAEEDITTLPEWRKNDLRFINKVWPKEKP